MNATSPGVNRKSMASGIKLPGRTPARQMLAGEASSARRRYFA